MEAVDRTQQRHRDAEHERRQRYYNNHSRLWWGEQGDDDFTNNNNRRWVGEELLRDALQNDRPGRRSRLSRPPRESSLRFEVAPSPAIVQSRPRSSRSPRTTSRTYMPSPPYTLNESHATRASSDRPPRSIENSPTDLTPGFAPALSFHSADASSNSERRTNEPLEPIIVEHSSYDEDVLRRLETPPAESWESSYPPLRRVGHLSPRPHPFNFDGLGDRQRSPNSLSSESGADDDTWETLLTTMEPDEHLPSATSSFTSATASASTSRRAGSAFNSNGSSQTRTTSIGDEECDPVGFNAPFADEGDDDDLMRRVDYRRREEGNTLNMPSRAGRMEHEGRRRWRVSEHLNRTAESRARQEQLRQAEGRETDADTDLSNMQRFIERMARREDIPDEWWSAAGLSRIVRDNQ